MDREKVEKLLIGAEIEISRADRANTTEKIQASALCAIARSLTAIAMIMLPDKITMYGSEQARWLNGE